MLPAPENPIGRSNAGCGPSCAEPTGKPVGADRISPVLERMILGQLPIPLSDPPTGGQLGPTQASASWEASAWVADL